MNIGNVIKQPAAWIWLAVVYLMVFNLTKLIAVIGPPVVIAVICDADSVLTVADLHKATALYVRKVGSYLEVSSSLLFVLFIYSGISSVIFLSVAPFLALGRSWARHVVMSLIIFELCVAVVGGIIQRNFTSIGTTSAYIVILGVLFWSPVVNTFIRNSDNM